MKSDCIPATPKMDPSPMPVSMSNDSALAFALV